MSLPTARIPCKRCGVPTDMTGTKLCDGCWEFSRRFSGTREEKLAQLGARVLESVVEYLKMVRAGTPRSGAEHWLAGESFDAARSLGLLTDAPPKRCSRCLDGSVLSEVCDECNERHCEACEPCAASDTDRDHDVAQDARATGAWPSAPDRGREDAPDTARGRMESL